MKMIYICFWKLQIVGIDGSQKIAFFRLPLRPYPSKSRSDPFWCQEKNDWVAFRYCRALGTGGVGGGGQILADTLTLFESGGGILCPPHYYSIPPPPIFRPSYSLLHLTLKGGSIRISENFEVTSFLRRQKKCRGITTHRLYLILNGKRRGRSFQW